jgi:putative chitinase
MQINKHQLLRALVGIARPSAKSLDEFVASFNQWAMVYEINNTKRLVHYLAQVMHESACLRYTTEIASGAAYDTGAKAIALGNTPEKDGDGQKYKGRGYIQLTGRANYKAFSDSDLCMEDVLKYPEKVALFPLNQMASMWFWQTKGLNTLADLDDGGKVGEDIVRRITQKVNGGQNGIAERLLYYRRFKKEYGL